MLVEDAGRRFFCKRCGGVVQAPGVRRKPRPTRETLGWKDLTVRLAGIAAAAGVAAAWLMWDGGDAAASVHADLDAGYVRLADLLARVETAADAQAVQPALVEGTAEINALLKAAEPYGTPRAEVMPVVWARYRDSLSGRLNYLRSQKSRVFNIQGAGRFVSGGLSQLPQADKQLRAVLTEQSSAGS